MCALSSGVSRTTHVEEDLASLDWLHPGKDRMEVYPGVSMDPDVRFGKPCVAGTRIDVATVVAGVAAGESAEAVANEYGLSVEQVRAALGYAAHVAAHQAPAVRKAS